MTKRRQVRGVVQQFHPNHHTVLWKAQRIAIFEAPQRNMLRCVGGVSQSAGTGIEAGPDHEAECSAKGVGGAQQGADIGRLGHTFDTDAEIAA
jgi:hypothetical protein